MPDQPDSTPLPPEPTPPSPPAAQSPPRRSFGGRLARGLYEWAKSLSLAVLLFLVVRAFLVEAYKIPSGSMERTLLVGDFLLVNKLVYGAEVPLTGRRLPAVRQPQRGDVIVFLYPKDPTRNYVKRLVGLPGDTVAMVRGVLIRNGKRQVEPYATHSSSESDPGSEQFDWQKGFLVRSAAARPTYHPSRDNWGPLVVPRAHLFVLGDNRDNSEDSRYWGFVPDSLVRGRPMLVYYSYAPDDSAPLAWLTRVRWNRIFERVR